VSKIARHFWPFSIALVALGLAGTARAHDAAKPVSGWTINVWLLMLLGAMGTLYVCGMRARAHKSRNQRVALSLESASFALCLATLVIALLSPLDGLSDLSFAAHMTQHELLMLLAAPLFVLARPLPTYMQALPTAARMRVAAVLRARVATKLFRALTTPWFALLTHGALRWLWHLPSWFQAALANEWIHGVQHASFFSSALLFWWGLVHGRYGRAGYGVAALFVLATAIHTGFLGALLSFSDRIWYPVYEARRNAAGLQVLSDQQLAGLIMWVGAFVWFLFLFLSLALAWLGEARRRAGHGTVAELTALREAS
jgi:putative membrane protein